MSSYRKLTDGNYISQFETTNTILHTADNIVVSPISPVSDQGISWVGNLPVVENPSFGKKESVSQFLSQTQKARGSTTYGPASAGYASLRYYGTGPY